MPPALAWQSKAGGAARRSVVVEVMRSPWSAGRERTGRMRALEVACAGAAHVADHQHLVGGAQHARDPVEAARVGADEHAARIARDAGEDLPRGVVGRRRVDQAVRLTAVGRLVLAGQRMDAGVDARCVDDVRCDAARMHAGRADGGTVELQLHPQRLGEAAHRELGRVVRALGRHRDQPEQARRVDDVAVAGRAQMGQKRLRAMHDAPEVDPDDPFEIVEARGFGAGRERYARVVEDQVDLAVRLAHEVGPRKHRVAVGDVEPLRRHAHAVPRAGGRRAREPDVVDVRERDLAAAPRELDRETAAHARTGAGDRGDLPGKPLHLSFLPCPLALCRRRAYCGVACHQFSFRVS
ncbi:hypothetical protein WM29_18580 [Burkholderia ubonensis]|nr:hypothetical protein WM29_18580 [Burkholderia ubonensis]